MTNELLAEGMSAENIKSILFGKINSLQRWYVHRREWIKQYYRLDHRTNFNISSGWLQITSVLASLWHLSTFSYLFWLIDSDLKFFVNEKLWQKSSTQTLKPSQSHTAPYKIVNRPPRTQPSSYGFKSTESTISIESTDIDIAEKSMSKFVKTMIKIDPYIPVAKKNSNIHSCVLDYISKLYPCFYWKELDLVVEPKSQVLLGSLCHKYNLNYF